MRRIKYKTSVSLLIVLASVVLVLLCLLIVHTFRTGEEATVGIFSLAATLVGTLFIAIELKNGSDVTCSEMLIDLNNYFHDSDRLMKVYEILETAETEGDYGYDRWKDVSSVEVAQYCTFFENLYLLYRHHIANIEDLDDLFGYRFFLFMNNPYIQENTYFLHLRPMFRCSSCTRYGSSIAKKRTAGRTAGKGMCLARNSCSLSPILRTNCISSMTDFRSIIRLWLNCLTGSG